MAANTIIKWFIISIIKYIYIAVISTRANNTTNTEMIDSQLDSDNTVNDKVPTKTARSLVINDQPYDVSKWVSFAGKQVLYFGDIHNCKPEITSHVYIS